MSDPYPTALNNQISCEGRYYAGIKYLASEAKGLTVPSVTSDVQDIALPQAI